jgi:starch-binding outer membrane protein, SusD/RagB family
MKIMKNTVKTLLSLMILFLSGCSTDYLTPDPKTSLGELQAFDTKDRVVGQVNGMYAFMKSGAYLGGRYQVYNDVRADNFLPKSTNLVTNYATWNHSVLTSTNEVINCWGAVYSAVNAINIFMEGLDANWKDGKLTGKITEAEYNQFKSEALALRAICYFHMLMLYAQPYAKDNGASLGLPLRLVAYKTGAENDMARSKVSEVYTQILSDLNTAETLAIDKYSTDLLNTTRIHKNTIIAFKTRVYLCMNDFAKVQTEAAKIVSASAPFTSPSGVAFALNSTFAGIFATPYTSKESVFSMPFTSTNLPGTQNGLAHYHHPSSSESYYLNTAAGSTYSKMDAADARKLLFASGTVSGKTEYYCGKYTNYTVQADYAPVIRYAEVLLNYAEAIVRGGSAVTQKAVDLLNAVRTRSFAAGAYKLSDFATVQAFQDAMLLERSMEFLGEGLRSIDLLRTLTTIPTKGGVPAVALNTPTYIWPIPSSEMDINKLMVGN